MAETFTPNYALSKFDDGDDPGATKLNANWTAIDAAIAAAATQNNHNHTQAQVTGLVAALHSTTKSTGDQTATTATLADVTGLSFAVLAGVTYHFTFRCIHRSTVSTVGLKIGLTFPAVTRMAATARVPIAAAGTASEFSGPITASGGSVSGTAVPVIDTDYLCTVEGVITPSADGTLQLQFAAETTGATVTLKQGSTGELKSY